MYLSLFITNKKHSLTIKQTTMYFITKKTSATGKKFQAVDTKMDKIYDAQRVIAKEIGFNQWREGYWTSYGGFSCLIFKEKPDGEIYKRQEDGWMPRLNTKIGKEIQAKLDACPIMERDELNKCIGFGGAPFSVIGFYRNNKTYFGFVGNESWDMKIPKDCEEVTTTKFNSIF